MLREWEKKYPGRIDSIFGALGNVVPSHLMDRALFDFGAVRTTGSAVADGDIAFDVDPVLERAADLAAAGADASASTPSACSARPTTDDRIAAAPRPCARSQDSPCGASRRSAMLCGCGLRSLLAVSFAAGAAQSVDTAPAKPTLAGAGAAERIARGRLRPLLPAHGDGLRPERRKNDRLRGLREPAQPHRCRPRRRARDRRRDPLARHSRSAKSSRAPSAGRAKPRS